MDTGIGKRHMVIKYSMDTTGYYLRDLGDGSGTFVRLDIPLVNYSLFTSLDFETWIHYLIWWLTYGCLVLLRQLENG